MVFPQQIDVEEIQPEPQPKSVEEKIEIAFGEEAEIMKKIFICESNLKQFSDNGEPLQSPTRDFGISQINEKTWDKKAQELGLDYKHSIDDNLAMAKYVYEVSGKTAWACYKKVV